MPLLLALLASAGLHLSVVLSEGWTLPTLTSVEELEVTLPAPVPPVIVPVAEAPKPAPAAPAAKRPPPKPALAPAPADSPAPPIAPASDAIPVPEAVASAAPAADASVAPALTPVPQDIAEPAPTPRPALAAISRLPREATWHYRVTRGEGGLLIGRAVFSWQQDGTHYTARSETETMGIAALFVDAKVVQSSSGDIDDFGLHPRHFRHVTPKRSDEATIDPAAGWVRNNGREAPLGAHAGALQDLLSMYWQLGLLLASDAPPSGAIEMPLATGRKLEVYHFIPVGEATLRRGGERWQTRHLRVDTGKDRVDLWYAPELPMPVRMQFADRKGDVYEQWLDLTEKGNS